jgi:N-acetylglucosamine kinase-like BadF-type ATPase
MSGDWGGGYDIGVAALAAAVRAADGRGPGTALAHLVPNHFGIARPGGLMVAFHTGRIEEDRVMELPALVFAAAAAGDDVAGAIVDRQADELVVMAAAAITRLKLRRSVVDVVLGGGILTSGERRLLDRVTAGVVAVAPAARMIPLRTLPVAGAALLGLDELTAVPTTDVRTALANPRPAEEDS